MEIKKKDGRKEAFDEKKLRRSIQKAVIDAGATVEEKKEVIEKVVKETIETIGEKGEVSTQALRDTVLGALDKVDSAISAAWRSFDKKYKNK